MIGTLRAVILFACLAVAGCERQTAVDPAVVALAGEIDEELLDGLTRKREGTRYLRRAMFHLESARREGRELTKIIEQAQRLNGDHGTARAAAVRERLLENHSILEGLGCLEEAGFQKLKTGNAPTITVEPHAGEIASVDHILPRSVVAELDNRLYNLRFMPEPLDGKKGNTIESWQVLLARQWGEAGLLSAEGVKAVEEAGGER
jgi:hypothetical protein